VAGWFAVTSVKISENITFLENHISVVLVFSDVSAKLFFFEKVLFYVIFTDITANRPTTDSAKP
jgi:hypothetical protein